MANEDFDARGAIPTTPRDLKDPPRFTQILETTQDAFVIHLRRFFRIDQRAARVEELPTVKKFAYSKDELDNDPYVSALRVYQDFPDTLEDLPHLSVTASGARNKRMTLGRPYVAQTQRPPRVTGTAAEPFALNGGERLVYRTKPDGVTWVTSTAIFPAARFSTANPVTAATATDMARVFNEQALYAHATVIELGGGAGFGIEIATGGPQGKTLPNAIEILPTSDADLLTALGLTVGQYDDSDNTARPPMNRYHQGAELTVNIDVLTPGVNTRRELADLVYGWATFWLEQQNFELHGRSVFTETTTEEHYQIILHQEAQMAASSTVNRTADGKDKVHIQRISVPVTTFMYIDRPVVAPNGSNWITNSEDLTEDDDLPTPN